MKPEFSGTRIALFGCALAGFLALISVLANAKNQTYDVFKYRPLVPGTHFTYSSPGLNNGSPVKSFAVLREETQDGLTFKVLDWGGGWTDYWEETPTGVSRNKHVNEAEKTYGVYTPPAVQYPRFLKPGEEFIQDRMLRTYHNGLLTSTDTEKFRLVLLGIEDITVPYGTFKNCLKIFSEWRNVDAGGREYQRRSVMSWNAAGVGQVKGIYYEQNDNEKGPPILTDMELQAVTTVPGAGAASAQK